MRPINSADEHNSCHLSLITCHYVRYALIRCLVFTNEQWAGERIAAYALARSCRLSQRFGGMVDPGLLVELAMNAVTSDTRQLTTGRSGKPDEILLLPPTCRLAPLTSPLMPPTRFFCGGSDAPMLFVLNGAMCSVAGAINSVWRLARDLLVLHYIEGLSPAELGVIHRMPAGRVEVALEDARREFVELLRGFSEWADGPEPDAGTVLTQLAGCLDEACVRTVWECVMQYLADCT